MLAIDYTSEKGQTYWKDFIEKAHNEVPFDGLWIDMNEIDGFCDGDCVNTTVVDLETQKKITGYNFDVNNPPYIPGGNSLTKRSIFMDSKLNLSVYYNLKEMFGFYESLSTRKALDSILKKRSLIISRSSYPYSGHFISQWLGFIYFFKKIKYLITN